MVSILYVPIFFCVLFLRCFSYPANEYEGKRCGDGFAGTSGICTAVPDCPSAKDALIKHHFHNLKRCGFAGFTEIVCCPNGDSTRDTFDPFGGDKNHHHHHNQNIDYNGHGYGSGEEHFHDTRNVPTTTSSSLSSSFGRKYPSPSPDEDNTTSERKPNFTKKRKSAQVCEEYSNEVPPKVFYQILGGENAQVGEFPHMAALGYNNSDSSDLRWDCGGSLISDRYVLTAAHCAKTRSGDQPVKVRLGKIDISGNSDGVEAHDYDVEQITVHPDYVRRTRYNDIALLRLSKKVVNSQNVHPACLYDKNDDPEGLVVTGWGATELGGTGSNILQKVTLNPVSVSECNGTYVKRISRTILNSQICAKSDDGTKDTCQGDSGGPIQIQHIPSSSIYTIVGVTSFGIGCGGPPGVYARIYSYLDWIENIVWPQ